MLDWIKEWTTIQNIFLKNDVRLFLWRTIHLNVKIMTTYLARFFKTAYSYYNILGKLQICNYS